MSEGSGGSAYETIDDLRISMEGPSIADIERIESKREKLTHEALRLGVLVDHKSNIETVLIDSEGGDKAKAIENYFADFLLSLVEEKPHADVFLAWIVERWRGHGSR